MPGPSDRRDAALMSGNPTARRSAPVH